MGKIRVKTFGDEEQELKEKEKLEARKQAKKAEKQSAETQTQEDFVEPVTEAVEEKAEASKTKSSYSQKAKKKAPHSKNYQNLLTLIDRAKTYTLAEALELLEKLQRGKLDETVELHLNTLTAGLSGNITLPHGTGKKTKVAIATDALIAEIEKGIINFDILVAAPEMMAKLARVAKVLGPKGLMPNPKNGTIAQNPQDIAKKYEGGQVNFKTEAKTPVMHLTVGKMSFGKEKLTQNIEALITAVKKSNIVNITLKSTMSPGIKIKI
nr:50S ribosomal protein L1 [Candidatus Levybacteria bacterium]